MSWCGLMLLVLTTLAGATGPAAFASPIRFREVAKAWNAEFRHHSGADDDFYMVETLGSGVVLFDYDGDGDPDLLYVDSGAVPGYDGEAPRTRLLRNDLAAGGVFVDVTEASGIEVPSYGMGGTAGDVDGDGDLDLYITAYGPNQLCLNRGDGSFERTADPGPLGVATWSASAGFADGDGDGDLDLYVADYVDFSWQNNPVCGVREKGRRSYCHPDVYDGMPDHFFLGSGDGTFENASDSAGVNRFEDGTPRLGKGLGIVWSDFDNDHRPDIYVANDMTPNFLFTNLGGGRFEEGAVLLGTAVSHLGNEEAGMGVASADIDSDGNFDLFVTHLDLQTNALYGNLGGIFVDRRFVSGLGEPSMFKVGFGTDFEDLDLDGDLDLVVANGHIVHNIEDWGTGSTYKQRNQVFENQSGRFQEIEDSGADIVRASRGLAAGDLDFDGDIDLVINNSNDMSEVYENVTESSGHWLEVDVRRRISATYPGRDPFALGTRIELVTGDLTQLREVRSASSYMSQNPFTAHFGMGIAEPRELRLHWPWQEGEPARVLRVRGLPTDVRVRVASQD